MNTPYKDLEQGAARLKTAIEKRDDNLKGLVKTHFSKFVNAKVTIDLFYKEMKFKNLVTYEEYGINPYYNALQEVEIKANKLYGPVLERRSKADKIRIALSILEQWKFFFNLPSSLLDMIRRVSYDNDSVATTVQ
jgi:exocyst complex component 2